VVAIDLQNRENALNVPSYNLNIGADYLVQASTHALQLASKSNLLVPISSKLPAFKKMVQELGATPKSCLKHLSRRR
jgi:hypothetical protein